MCLLTRAAACGTDRLEEEKHDRNNLTLALSSLPSSRLPRHLHLFLLRCRCVTTHLPQTHNHTFLLPFLKHWIKLKKIGKQQPVTAAGSVTYRLLASTVNVSTFMLILMNPHDNPDEMSSRFEERLNKKNL